MWRVIILLFGLPGSLFAADRPAALVRMEQGRSAIQTGYFTGTFEMFLTDSEGQGRRLLHHFTCRQAGDDRIWIDRGDDEGVVLRDKLGNAPPPGSQFSHPVQRLIHKGRIWSHEEQWPTAETFVEDRPNTLLRDLRALGMASGITFQSPAESLWLDAPSAGPRRYTQRRDGNLEVVTAELDNGFRRTWWIDPERGWNAVRVLAEYKGRFFGEARVSLSKYGDLWFPQRTEYYSADWKDGKEPEEVYCIDTIRVNQPGDPKEFTPEDIGVTDGMFVQVRGRNMEEIASGIVYGGMVVPMAEYTAERIAAAKATPDQFADWTAEQVRQRVTKTTAFISAWEQYTRDFIARYGLDPAQTEQAWRILRDCQGMADNYLVRRRSEIERIQAKLTPLLGASEAGKRAEAKGLGNVLDRLCRPIDDLFENRLKPRLDTLPSPKQRKAAAPATQPAPEAKRAP